MAGRVVAFGTLDTKAEEYGYLIERLAGAGARTTLVDTGIGGHRDIEADISNADVARAAGVTLEALVAAGDRGAAITAMAIGATRIAQRLHAAGELDAMIGIGGSGGAHIASRVAQGLPFGVPKLIVSTIAAGDTRPYVGGTDVTMMYPVVDIGGLNRISRQVLSNAAAAIAAMAGAPTLERDGDRLVVAATMFGVTTAGVTVLRTRLESHGYEVLVFHCTGVGGRSMEALIAAGQIDAVADVTTTELADDLVGGVCSAGPERLRAAAIAGIPQVVSVGALDMVNFGPRATVPDRFSDRTLYAHNPEVTLMRTTAGECAELGRRIAVKCNAARGPVTVFLPTGGFSALSVAGQPFHDPAADGALLDALRSGLDPGVDCRTVDTDINAPDLAAEMAECLHRYLSWSERATTAPPQAEGAT